MKYCISIAIMLLTSIGVFAQKSDMMIRIAEIEIHSTYLEEYTKILQEEAEASVRLKPGVYSIFPMYQ